MRLSQLQSGVHGFTFEGKNPENAFVNPAQRFLPHEPFQRLDSKRKFPKCQGSLGAQSSGA